MADDDSSGSKYAYLLQPIKDLEKNFAIDLVLLLEAYTQELGVLAEAEEFQRNNAHRFNFAEAGMLIHGSAAVLAKKVDLVHSHALNFYQLLENAKSKKKNQEADDGDEGIGGDDDDDPFIAASTDSCVLRDCSRIKPTNLSSLVSKNSHNEILSISIMPMSLMPLADFEKCNVPIYNSKNKNEVVGKKDDFKINTGYMSRSGALLLDLLNEALVEQFMTTQQKPESSNEGEDSGRCSPVDDPASEMNLPELPCSQEFDPGRPSNAVEIVRRAAGPSIDVAQIPRPSSVFLKADGKPSQPLEALHEVNFSDMNTDGGFDDNNVTPALPVRKPDPWDVNDSQIDPLIQLCDDPFDEVPWKSKPFNKSNNCLNLEAVLARKKRADEKRERKEKLMETIEFVNDQIYCLGKKQRIKRQIGLGTQYKWEIDAILPYISNQQKRRDKIRRENLAQRKLDEKLGLRGRRNAKHLLDLDEDEDYADGFDDERTHFGDDAPNYVPAETIPRPLMATVDDADLAENIAFPTIIFDPASLNAEAGAYVKKMAEKIHEYMTLEEIITFYRKKYWEQTAEAMSKLAARVQEWDEKMQPLLEEEETRKEFSIHAYGTELLAFFGKLDDVRALPQLLKGKVHYEISRYFLSTLMMANTMNLEIINEQQDGPDPLKMMKMKLLTRERHHEIFEGNGDL